MTLKITTPDGITYSTPHGFDAAEDAAMRAATTAQTYIDGDREIITVVTRCGTVEESDPGFFYDGNWVDWVPATYPGWTWARGSGVHDDGGSWFAQEHRLGDQFIWVAVGSRPAEPFTHLIMALLDEGIQSEVIDTGGQTMRLYVEGPNGIEIQFSDEHTSAIAYDDEGNWTQYDPPQTRELPDGIWDQDTAQRVAAWFAPLRSTITVEA